MTGGQELRSKVIDTGLCTRCGGCVASCPADALAFTRNGIELKDGCIDCGNCVTICPGKGMDLSSHEKRCFGKSRDKPFGKKLGIYRKRIDLSAGEKEVFKAGYFGGRVSAICIHGLEKGMIDAALLTDWSDSEDLSIGKGVIARNREDVLRYASTKYVFSPVLSRLKDVARDGSINRVALVGLPCQIHAFRNMEQHDGTKHLTEKVKYVISLNCGAANLDEEGWGKIIYKLTGVKREDICGFKAFKISGKTIRFTVTEKNGNDHTKDIPMSRYMLAIGEIGVWERCGMCPDYAGDLSDISFGAPVIRTERGEELIRSAMEAGHLKKSKRNRMIAQYLVDLWAPFRKRWKARKNIKSRGSSGMYIPEYR
jgi:coenzyme F420 hydrogenase subunit beta